MFIFQITLQHDFPFFKRLKTWDLYRTLHTTSVFFKAKLKIQQSSRRSNVDSSKVWLLQIELRTYRARPDLSPKAQSKVRVFLKTHTFLEHPTMTHIFKEKKPKNNKMPIEINLKILNQQSALIPSSTICSKKTVAVFLYVYFSNYRLFF